MEEVEISLDLLVFIYLFIILYILKFIEALFGKGGKK